MDAAVQRSVRDVEIESVLRGEIRVRTCPAVGRHDFARQIERLLARMALDAVTIQHVLHQSHVVEWIRAIHIRRNR